MVRIKTTARIVEAKPKEAPAPPAAEKKRAGRKRAAPAAPPAAAPAPKKAKKQKQKKEKKPKKKKQKKDEAEKREEEALTTDDDAQSEGDEERAAEMIAEAASKKREKRIVESDAEQEEQRSDAEEKMEEEQQEEQEEQQEEEEEEEEEEQEESDAEEKKKSAKKKKARASVSGKEPRSTKTRKEIEKRAREKEVEKRKKQRRAVLRLKNEILAAQRSEGLCIRRAPFQRLVQEIVDAERGKHPLRMQGSALALLQGAAEAFLTSTFSISNSFSIHAKRVTVLPRDIKLMLKTHEALQPMGIPVYESAVRAKLVNQDVENPEWRYEGQPGYVQRNTNFSPEKREKEWKHVSLRKVYIPDSNKFTDAHLQYLRDRVAIVEAEKAAAMEEAGRQFADDDAAKEAAFEAIEKRYETCLGRRQEEIEAVKKVLDRRKQAKEAKAAKRG